MGLFSNAAAAAARAASAIGEPPPKPIARRGGNQHGTIQKPTVPGYHLPPKKTPPPGGSSPAPTDKAAADKAAAVAASAPSAADLITQYGLAKAKILQAMAPQIQDIFSRANTDLQGAVSPLTQEVRSRLFGAGSEASADLGRQLGGLTSLGTDVTPSFNPEATANAAYALGAAFPGESLIKQGANFGAAAALVPGASLEQTQMALSKYLSDQQVSAAKQSAVNVGVSKLLGYISDANGQPITGKDGKKIPLPKQGLTPYQLESTRLREQELKDRQASRKETARLRVLGLNQSDAHFVANMKFKTDQQKQKLLDQIKKGQAIDWTATKATGVIHLKDGTIPKQSNGHVYSYTPPPKPPSTAAISKAVSQGQKYLRMHLKGYMASENDLNTPLSAAQLSAIAKQYKIKVSDLLYSTDPKAEQIRNAAGLHSVQIGQHDDKEIQDLYEALVKVYRIPARRAFNIVAKSYPQWGKAMKPTYFPKGT